MHYGGIIGSQQDAESFRARLADKVRVEILHKS